MTQPTVSIKWPSQASVSRRLKGLKEIQARVVNSRPEPFYGAWDYKKGKWRAKPKSMTPQGDKWKAMNLAISQLVMEAEDLLKMVQQNASKNRAKKVANVTG